MARWLRDTGCEVLTEFPLKTGRRVDVIGVDRRGHFHVVEIKTSRADLRGDRKWSDYRPFCDRLSFAVPEGFDLDLPPADAGLLVADAHGAAEIRPAPVHAMNPQRRRTQTLAFARAAAARLHAVENPPVRRG